MRSLYEIITAVIILLSLLVGIYGGRLYEQNEIERRAAIYIDSCATIEQQQAIEYILFEESQQ